MTPDDFLRLSKAGLTPEQIALVMEIMTREASAVAAKEEERKAKGRERWHRWHNKRETNVSQREQTLANDSCEGVTRGEDNLQTKKISGQEEKKDSAAKPRSDLADFRSELSSILDHERIEALVAVRRKKGATMTANTGRLLVAAIRRCPISPGDVADEMALRNWTSVKPDWLRSRSSPPRQSTDPPRPPRNAGELSYQQLMGQTDEYTSENDRRLGSGDGDTKTPDLGSFQKFAVSGELLRRM